MFSYEQHWIIDNMPVTWCYDTEGSNKFCTTGFPMGCYVTPQGRVIKFRIRAYPGKFEKLNQKMEISSKSQNWKQKIENVLKISKFWQFCWKSQNFDKSTMLLKMSKFLILVENLEILIFLVKIAKLCTILLKRSNLCIISWKFQKNGKKILIWKCQTFIYFLRIPDTTFLQLYLKARRKTPVSFRNITESRLLFTFLTTWTLQSTIILEKEMC